MTQIEKPPTDEQTWTPLERVARQLIVQDYWNRPDWDDPDLTYLAWLWDQPQINARYLDKAERVMAVAGL